MCVSLGVIAAVASSVVGFVGQQAAYQAQKAQYDANVKAADQAAVNRYASQQQRILQERDAASQKMQQSSLDALKARSTARTAAGEAGIEGLSVDSILQDLSAQQGRYEASVDKNFQMNQDYLKNEMVATQDQAQARINSMPIPQEPSFGAALVNIFSSGVNAYAQDKIANGQDG